MKAEERDRHDLHTGLKGILGPDRAATLMAHLSPVAWPDVATKKDLEKLGAATKADLENHRAATKKDLDHLSAATQKDLENHRAATKKDLDNLSAATKKDLDNLSAATKKDLDNLGAATKKDLDHLSETLLLEIEASADRVRADLLRQMNLQTRTMIFALLAAIFTVAGVVGSLAFSIR